MEKFNTFRIIFAFLALILLLVSFAFKNRKKIDIKFMTRTAIFAAMSTILYTVPFLKFKLPFFPSFLEIHLDEVPLLIAGFAYGPLSGIFALLIKTIIKLPMTSTMGVGELADYVYSLFFIVPSAIIYQKHRNMKGALVGLGVGTITQILAASFITTFVILDFYMVVMNLPKGAIMGMITKAGIHIDNLLWPFFLYVGLPFNALKDAMVVALTLLLYKRIHILVEKIPQKRAQKN